MGLKKLTSKSKEVEIYDVVQKKKVSKKIKDVKFGKKKQPSSSRVMHFARHKKLYRIISKDDYQMLKWLY